ncbi:hypothetical protein D3C77_277560 [compost metagenome]
MTEVEAQALAIDQRALLLYVIAQHLAQRRVQQVGGGVVQRGGVLNIGIDPGLHLSTDGQGAAGHHTVVQEGAAGLGGVAHIEAHVARLQVAGVTNLAAGLGVERRTVEDDHTLLAFTQLLDDLAVLIKSNDAGAAFGGVVAGELGRHVDLDQGVVVQAEGAGGAGTLTLGFHLALEACFVDGQLAFAGDVGGQVHREAVGVIELEHHVTRNHAALELGQVLLEDLQALLQGLGELLFFSLEHALDVGLLLRELRECFAHLGHQGGNDLVEEAAGGAQLVTVAASATDDAAQHVAAAFVGRQHAVGNQEAAGTDVVGHHFERRLLFVGAANGGGRSAEQVAEQVDLVVRVHMLHDRTDALQAHAGIHRRCWQRVQHAIGSTVELHENVVPDLDVTVTVFFRRAGWAAPDVRAVVIEDLGARAARTGITHGPEVVGGVRGTLVVADAHHALFGNADFLGPDVVCLIVAGIDGDPEFLFRQVQHLGQEGPGVGDGVFLEIVTEAEVTQHFEEGVVTGGVADVFQVAVLATGAHALLAAGRAGVGALFLAKEAVLELVHPRVGEQQGRVVARNQGAGGNSGVSLLFEEAKEGFTDFCAFHRFFHGNGGLKANACVKLTKRRQRAALYRALGLGAVCLCYRNRQLDGLQRHSQTKAVKTSFATHA